AVPPLRLNICTSCLMLPLPLLLTFEGNIPTLPLVLREEGNVQDRLTPRHPRPADSQDPHARSQSRMGHLQPHSADLARWVEREPRVALPGSSPPGAARRRRIGNEAVGEQPPGPCLHVDPSRPPTAGDRERVLGTIRPVGGADSERRMTPDR